MTVGELIKILKQYPKNYLISVVGGEGCDGDWAQLSVCKNEKDACWQYGEVIATEEETFDKYSLGEN